MTLFFKLWLVDGWCCCSAASLIGMLLGWGLILLVIQICYLMVGTLFPSSWLHLFCSNVNWRMNLIRMKIHLFSLACIWCCSFVNLTC